MFNKDLTNKLNSYFINKLNMREYRRGWLKGDCPFCNRHDKFGVNLYLNRTNCFVCGEQPKPMYLVKILENLDTYDEVKVLLGDLRSIEYIAPVVKTIDETKMVLPTGYMNISLGRGRVARLARNYVRNRGFDIGEVANKGWGYTVENDKYFGYLIIPFYMGGKLVYFNARKFFGNGPKYSNPEAEESGIGKSLIIYNSDALYTYKEVYLMEGAINAETIGDQGIATGGKDVSNKQLSLITKSPIESIVLLLDPDAILNTLRIAMEISFHKKVKVVYWEGDKDVNDLGREETLKRVEKAPYNTYNDLLKMNNKFKYSEKVKL